MDMRSAGSSVAHRLPAVCLTALFAQGILSADLCAQAGGTLSGIVTAANHMPIADAKVRLVGTSLNTVTREDGAFLVAQVPTGLQSVEVRMVGYAPKTVAVDLAAGETMSLTLILEPVILDTVKVTGESIFSPGMGAFEERRARGNGRYFTRADIDKMQARQVTDILRRVPGMRIQNGSGAFGGSQTAQTGRNISSSGSRTCPMAYYVNGTPFPLTNDVPINHYFTPEDVVAMEVYTGASQLPAQFNSTNSTARCGVVVIWTRNGVDGRIER